MIRYVTAFTAALFVMSLPLAAQTGKGTGALMRGLDKVSGQPIDFMMKLGDTTEIGQLRITLGECRFPTDNPSGDAYAWLVIRDRNSEKTAFEGWMIASSPALNALDHPRYDVWVLNCTTE